MRRPVTVRLPLRPALVSMLLVALALTVPAEANPRQAKQRRDVLIMIDASGSVGSAGSLAVQRYRSAPIETLHQVFDRAGDLETRVWIAAFNHEIKLYDPSRASRPFQPVHRDFYPPESDAPEARAQAQKRFSAAMTGVLGNAMRVQAVTKAHLPRAVERLVAPDPDQSWVPGGATDLVNAIFFAVEFAHSVGGASIYFYTDKKHHLANRSQFGHTNPLTGKPFRVRGAQPKKLTDEAIEYAIARIAKMNETRITSDFVLWKWAPDSSEYRIWVPSPIPAYSLFTLPETPEFVLESYLTGRTRGAVPAERIRFLAQRPLVVAGHAPSGVPSASVPIRVTRMSIEMAPGRADLTEAARKVGLKPLARQSFTLGIEPADAEGYGPARLVEQQIVDRIEFAGLSDGDAVRTLISSPTPLTVRIDMAFDSSELPHRKDDPRERYAARWAVNPDCEPPVTVNARLLIREIAQFDVRPAESDRIYAVPLNRGATRVPLRVFWNRPARGAEIEVLGPSWVKVGFVTGESPGAPTGTARMKLTGGDNEPGRDVYLALQAIAAAPEARDVPLTFRWSDSRQPLKFPQRVTLRALSGSGGARVTAEARATQLDAYDGSSIVARIRVAPEDQNAGERALRFDLEGTPGLDVRLREKGVDLPLSRGAAGRKSYRVELPAYDVSAGTYRDLDVLVAPSYSAIGGSRPPGCRVRWQRASESDAILAEGSWPATGWHELKLPDVELQIEYPETTVWEDGYRVVDLGPGLEDGISLSPSAALRLAGDRFRAADDALVRRLDRLGRVTMAVDQQSGIGGIQFISRDGQAADSVSLGQLARDGVRFRIPVPTHTRELAGDVRIGARVTFRSDTADVVRLSWPTKEIYFIGYAAPRVPTIVWLTISLALLTVIISGVLFAARRPPAERADLAQATITGSGAAMAAPSLDDLTDEGPPEFVQGTAPIDESDLLGGDSGGPLLDEAPYDDDEEGLI